jgi:tripeptide aminopeptidase
MMMRSQAHSQRRYRPGSRVARVYARLASHPEIRKGVAFIKEDHGNTIREQREICEIAAPPFKEHTRAENFRNRLAALGLKDVQTDKEGNVLGRQPGTGRGPTLLVAAHLDTVFPAGTDVSVKEKEGKLYAPGISDDARGLAALLAIIRALQASGIKTIGDIIFCGNVGEEGLGDLRGVKALFRDHKDLAGFISIDGVGADKVSYLGTGSHRYEIAYQGPGGHSYQAFGRPSAIHAMGRAIARIADLTTPKEPKTTFTVGVVTGGTSVNSIAGDARMLVDMRSNGGKELLDFEARVLESAMKAAEEETARWGAEKVIVQIKRVGDRPAGRQSPDSLIVQTAWASTEAVGQKPFLGEPNSTDSNLPMSLGIPALTLGGGGAEENNHSLSESFDPTDAYLGPQRIFLTILGLAGVDGVSEPLLSPGK